MEAGKLLMGLILIIVSAVCVSIYISMVYPIARDQCQEKIVGDPDSVLSSLRQCVDMCWRKHNFGKDVYNDDCNTISLTLSDVLTKAEIENFINPSAPTTAYFNSLDRNIEYTIKVRYNYTNLEISLSKLEV